MRRIMIFLVLASILFTACEKFLDKPVKGRQTFDSFFTTEDECNQAVIGCYQSLSPEDWWEMDFYWLIGDVCSDDAFKGNSIEGDQQEFGNMARWIIDSQNEWLDIKWRYSYITISRANLIIEYVPLADIQEDLKVKLTAEAHFLRGLAYFELARNFGGVVLLEKQPAPNDIIPRSSIEDTWSFIENDFKLAAENLPLKSEQAGEERGRATKGSALAYLARTYLYMEDFENSRITAEKVIQSFEYELEENFESIWSIQNPNGKESIFEIQNNYDPVQYTGSALPVLTRSRADGGWGFGTPSSHLEQFMSGDPRLKHTIIKHGDSVDQEHPSYDTQLDQNESGRINRKYYLSMADRVADSEHVKAPLNHILFRYADLLLTHAEAAAQSGAEALAIQSLKKVRDRVGLNTPNLSGNELLLAILDERRMELALEGHRYYDLKRTGLLALAMEDFVNYNLNTSTDLYDAGNQQGVLFNGEVHVLFPIPQSEIDASGGVVQQNPNY